LCDDCLPAHTRENAAATITAAHRTLTRLRAKGDDPAKRPASRVKVSEANSRRRAEEAAWDAEHGSINPEVFRLDILPKIQGVSLNRLSRASGLSIQYLGRIRRGIHVPHARHWEALRAAADPQVGHRDRS
jgi:hypothetical protein